MILFAQAQQLLCIPLAPTLSRQELGEAPCGGEAQCEDQMQLDAAARRTLGEAGMGKGRRAGIIPRDALGLRSLLLVAMMTCMVDRGVEGLTCGSGLSPKGSENLAPTCPDGEACLVSPHPLQVWDESCNVLSAWPLLACAVLATDDLN